MSSNMTEGFVPGAGRKLLVNIAENGHSFELDCDESTLVESVQRVMESVTGINLNDQLLLCLDMKLESQKPLSTYKLPCDGREVFLYNRARLLNDSPPPPLEQISLPEIANPSTPSSSGKSHPLDDALDPALKALPSYERQFRYHFQRGHAIFSLTQAKFENCERLLREQKVQQRALETARGSMDHYYKMIQQMYTEFMKCYSQQHRYHSDLLMNFERDIEKLRSCKLHPSLQSETRKRLLDFVKEENLRKWVDNCDSSHSQFETKVSQLKQMFHELKQRVEDLFSSKALSAIRDVELMIKDYKKHTNEQQSIMQSLSKDVNTVKKLVDDCLSSQLSSSLRPHDAVSALGPMYDVHDKSHLPKMQACDSAMSELLDFCRARKDEMNLFVHNCMQKVAYIQFTIRDLRLQFPAFKEAMTRQDDLFRNLKLVRGIGPAYRACLAEVVRRKASMKLYMGMAGQLSERVATKREAEVRRREEFLKAQSTYIPKDILISMGLFDIPNQCDVNIAPFDSNLLDIDIAELNNYAPEYLVDMLCKVEKHIIAKSSLSMSAEVEENTISIGEKYDSEEFNNDSELVEIAGTSKMEVENARLKADLASALVFICSFNPEKEYESLDDSKLESILKSTAEKAAEALHLKDEYGKHLQSILKAKHMQCMSYKKRIQELEQRLSDQYFEGQKLTHSKDVSDSAFSTANVDECKSGISGDGKADKPNICSESMDEISCLCLDAHGRPGKARESVDENMSDSVGLLRLQLDSSMADSQRYEIQEGDTTEKKAMDYLALEESGSAAGSTTGSQNMLPCETVAKPNSATDLGGDLMSELRSALADKSNQCTETEVELKVMLEEVANLRRELEVSNKLLDESQMNCAHLENCLHEAREEAHTHLCSADRRASEYSTLRASAVKMHSLFERFKSCVTISGGVASFVEALHALAFSLANSTNENEDESTAELRTCIRILADKVSCLSRNRSELQERCRRAEAAHEHLKKELEEKEDLIKSLYAKHQFEKQANKEKISFVRFEVHEIAAFVLNKAGHYKAINRNCPHYYLSTESVALFVENRPTRPSYILGQIVHIERKTVRPFPSVRSDYGVDQVDQLLSSDTAITRQPSSGSSNSGSTSNPYNLPIGCVYFIVTVAMLPDTTIHSPLPS